MPLFRWLSVIVFSSLLAACGGGGSLESDGGSLDGGDDSTAEASYEIAVQGFSLSSGEQDNQVTADSPLTISATLTNNDEAVAGVVINFSLNGDIGLLDPVSGTDLTDSNGVASIKLTAGDTAGAGIVTATYALDGDTYSDTFGFTSDGSESDDSSVSGSVTLNLTITDTSGAPFTVDNPVSKDNKGTVTATLLDEETPLAGQLISFSTNFTGKITPVLGTALTDSNGEAFVTLSSGDAKGAGQVVATYTDESGNAVTKIAGFISNGDEAPDDAIQYSVTASLLTGCVPSWDDNRSNVKLDPTSIASGCSITNSVSSAELADLFIEVTNQQSGDAVANALVEVTTDLGTVLPSSGRALTDSFGVALLKIQPGNTGGAGTITVSALDEQISTNFAVGIADLILEVDNGLNVDSNGDVIPLKAGGSTIIEVTLKDEEGNLYTTPTDVEFSSTCVDNNNSSIDASVKSSSGIASSTYRANGCGIDDVVNITVETGGKNFTASTIIPVEVSAVQSIQFIDVSEPVIALPPGEGGLPTQSVVRFRLLDADGIVSPQQRIDFKLTDSTGLAGLTQRTANTDNDGVVQTTVTSGIVPGPLVVKACFVSKTDVAALPEGDDLSCWTDEVQLCADEPTNDICPEGTLHLVPLAEQINAVSSQLALYSGITDQNSFDLSPQVFNPNALNYNGITNSLTVYFGDQFNQFNSNGVESTVLTESGAVGPQSNEAVCRTTDASCVVTWRSQGERPFYDYKWGNRIGEIDGNSATTEGINPKTGDVNCDPYFETAAPCIGTLVRAKNDPNGVIRGGRTSIIAVAKGQESFVDEESSDGITRRNGLFDIGEYYTLYDLPEAFNDHNENSTFDKANCSDADSDSYDPNTDQCSELNSRGGHNETWRDLNNNGIYDGADGLYNGLLCSEAAFNAGQCTRDLIEVRKQIEVVMSGDDPYVRFAVLKSNEVVSAPYEVLVPADCSSTIAGVFEVSDNALWCDVASIDLSEVSRANPDYDATDPNETDPETLEVGLSSINVRIFYSDEFGNPLPAGTEVSLTADNGDFSIIEHEETIPSTNRDSTMYSDVRIARESDGNQDQDGVLTITFQFENQLGGTKTVSRSISIIDDK
ncbi:hypothetical protein NH514_02325 [Pseudoalteromonas sp. ACER1]|uniref:hypothetical protein n=1 Tax=unclassified Pseudoalteromonas TaxID=194690 RepID=UPI001F31B702|nr:MULTISPECIES: hypothetical protein [unclassified Pseudoalteromonas]MCF2847249.1 hypothetical protein [Pseudoalteromonas sp. PAST1]MCO7209570.1 hypothetical protein [Pseudoalteromonas sp. ACER1]